MGERRPSLANTIKAMKAAGYTVESVRIGADGEIEIKVSRPGEPEREPSKWRKRIEALS